MIADDHDTLRFSLLLVTLDQSLRFCRTDWSDPDEGSAADRMSKVLSVYGRNIEKCIAMTQDLHAADTAGDADQAELVRLKSELQRRLVQYADRLGHAELARRLRARGLEEDARRLELLGEAGSASADKE